MKDSYTTLAMVELMYRARLRGYSCKIENHFGYCAVIQSEASEVSIIGADVGLNRSAASRISQDKYFTEKLLQSSDVRCISSKLIEATDPAPLQPELPCIIKPNNGCGGVGVSRIDELEQLEIAIELARQSSSEVLLQEVVESNEFRLVMLEGKCLFAYERTPWTIRGDGKHRIRDYITLYNQQAGQRNSIDEDDQRLQIRLKRNQITLDTVLDEGEMYQLMSNANLSAGGRWSRVVNIAPEYIQVSTAACKAIGLRYAGVDIFCDSLEKFDSQYKIIEINSNPGFEYLRGNKALLKPTFDKIADKLFEDL